MYTYVCSWMESSCKRQWNLPYAKRLTAEWRQPFDGKRKVTIQCLVWGRAKEISGVVGRIDCNCQSNKIKFISEMTIHTFHHVILHFFAWQQIVFYFHFSTPLLTTFSNYLSTPHNAGILHSRIEEDSRIWIYVYIYIYI